MDASKKAEKHDVCKRLKYRSHLDGMRYIEPYSEQVTFEHLEDADYLLLIRSKKIKLAETKPAPKKASTTKKDGD